MAADKKIQKRDGMPPMMKYALTLVIVAIVGYGSYMAQKSNDRTTANLRASCGTYGQSSGLTGFGSCR